MKQYSRPILLAALMAAACWPSTAQSQGQLPPDRPPFRGGRGPDGAGGPRRPPYPPFFDQLAKLPPEERRKALEANPRFQGMNPQQQDRQRQRLDEFVNLSEEQKAAIREQWAAMRNFGPPDGRGPQFRGGPGQPGMGRPEHAEGMPGGPRRPPFPPLFDELSKLPPAERQKALEANPAYQRMSPDKQAMLRKRMEDYAALSEEQKAKFRNRWAIMNDRSPEEQQRIRETFRRWSQIPEDRRPALHEEMHILRGLGPAEREKRFASPEFQKNFTAPEQGLLKDMAAMVRPPRPAPPTENK